MCGLHYLLFWSTLAPASGVALIWFVQIILALLVLFLFCLVFYFRLYITLPAKVTRRCNNVAA